MELKTLNRFDAQKEMEAWKARYPELKAVSDEYENIRRDIRQLHNDVRSSADNLPAEKRRDYYIDSQFGLKLYEYLWNVPGFNMRTAANDDFWRYLSVIVVPDIVAQRWGKENDSHYWSMPRRIWLRSIWWFVHLSWQGSIDATKTVLECKHFTTDTILNFEERTGKNGTYISTYRRIILYYSMLPPEIATSKGKDRSDDVFRIIMKLNTAKFLVMDPLLCSGGEDGYVKALFSELGVCIDVA